MPTKTAIIIGAGPAGLTVAYELLVKTDIKPVIFESSDTLGGLAKTLNYKGNRIDLGGHRFFSKSQRIADWWLKFLPQQMLSRRRISRIYFLGKFFAYPISLDWQTIKNLGLSRISRVMGSYILARILPIKPEKNLEDFFINRFGQELYSVFFRDYTKKVWGINCKEIDADWGAQRIRRLSVAKTLFYAIKKKLGFKRSDTETSLIEQFLYPEFGPGQFWETVAAKILELGGEIHKNSTVVSLENLNQRIAAVSLRQNGALKTITGDYIFSSMPIKDLLLGFGHKVPDAVLQVGANLQYRDFITVGLLLKKLPGEFPDNWLYIQDHEVKLGRIQIFNNWSPSLVKDRDTIWLGLEYFCFAEDEFWSLADAKIIAFATSELKKIFFLADSDFIDGVVIRVPKAYPAYFGVYHDFKIVKNYLDEYSNLFLIGRNGMHRYNNMDHSMLTAMTAVDNIVHNITSKDNIWTVNVDTKYHEAAE